MIPSGNAVNTHFQYFFGLSGTHKLVCETNGPRMKPWHPPLCRFAKLTATMFAVRSIHSKKKKRARLWFLTDPTRRFSFFLKSIYFLREKIERKMQARLFVPSLICTYDINTPLSLKLHKPKKTHS
jgi:hypothetical protein